MRFSPTFAVLGLVLAVACRGPEGPTGPAGPQGPTGPTTRVADYCNTTGSGVGASNSWTLSVSCNSAADIPVEGWCMFNQEPPAGAYLSNSAPVNWDNTSLVAGWTCTWAWTTGSTPLTFLAKAEICCATPH